MKVKILDNRITPSMLQPATTYSAGIDLRASINENILIYPGEQFKIPTGIMVAIPIGYVGLITPRSGLSTKYGLVLSNTVGVIDADYRGEVQLMIQRKPIDEPAFVIEPMARLAQLIIVPCYTVIEVVDSLDETDRGINGFGSTGHL